MNESELKKLIEEKKYDEVLSKTKKDKTPISFLYRSAAYFGLNRPDEALKVLLDNRDLLYPKYPLQTIKYTLEARYILLQFDEAYKDAEYFENQPYISQEVEEVLREMKNEIRRMEKLAYSSKKMDDEEILEALEKEEDDYALLGLLGRIRKADECYLPVLERIATGNNHPSVRTYALLLLVGFKSPREIEFKKGDMSFRITPADLTPPFQNDGYKDVKEEMNRLSKDPSLIKTASSLLDEATLDAYPMDLGEDKEPRLVAISSLYLASKYMKADLKEFGHIEGIDIKAIEKKADDIERYIEMIEPLKF